MKNRLISIFLIIILSSVLPSCLNQHFVSPDDFLYPQEKITKKEIKKKVYDLKSATGKKDDNAELHRRLSVFYRLMGTPHFRSLSITEINRAIELNPKEKVFYIEKGLTNMARRFYSEAGNNFKHALELDSLCVEAWYQLGRNEKIIYLRGMLYDAHIDKAIKYFKRVTNIAPGYRDALLNLAILNLLRKNIKEAREYALLLRSYYPDRSDTHLVLGTIYLKLHNFTESSGAFIKAFHVMRPQNQYFYSDISVLLSEEEKYLFQSLTADEKREYFRKFWIDRDPTPTTTVNERLLEHYKRVFLAFYLFTDRRLGYKGPESDRGKVVVSYGLPTNIFKVESKNVDSPLISWVYILPNRSFTLVFQDEFLNGDYHIPIDSFYMHYALKDNAIISNIKDCYQYPIAFEPFPILSEFVQLKGTDYKTSLMISVGIPDSIFTAKDDKYKLSFSILDNNRKRILEDDIFFSPDTLKKINRYNTTFSIFNHSVDLFPRIFNCTLFIDCNSVGGKKRSYIKKDFEFIDFSGNTLMISNLSLSECGKDSPCQIWPDPIQIYKPGAYLCLAYEIYNLETDNSNKTDYKLTYSINPILENYKPDDLLSFISSVIKKIRGKENRQTSFISNSILQSSYGNFISSRIKIDTGSLTAGNYKINITVLDILSGKKTQTKRNFKISIQ